MYAPAATGLLFAPGAGVADLMGRAPDPSQPGEYLPSFYENVTGGNYLDAGLQALGGAGDAVQMMGAAFPPLVAVGAGMKLPRAGRVASTADVFSEVADFPSLTKSEERVVAAASAPPEQVAGLGRVITEPIDPQNMAASKARFDQLREMTSGYEQERAKARIVRLDDGTDAIQYMEPPATVQSVPISQLKATQPGLLSGGDAPLTEGPPLVVKKGGEFFVRDGHHRLARMIEAGADVADVRLVDLDAGGLLGVEAPRGIRAYHGSPHHFDKFSTEYIGAGLLAPRPAGSIGMGGRVKASPSSRLYDDLFENMGDEGAGLEFPDVGEAVNKYIYDMDFDALQSALKSDDYVGYSKNLRTNLDSLFPNDKISVSRVENYSDPYAGIEGRRSKSFFDVNKDDVLFVGSDAERELIVRSASGSPMSVRIEETPRSSGLLGKKER
jgi:hypothetical protein